MSRMLSGRSSVHIAGVKELDRNIAADVPGNAGHFLPQRLVQRFDITCAKTQDAGRGRLHDAVTSRASLMS